MLLLGRMPDKFLKWIFFFFLILYEYFSYSLIWDPIGAKISKRYSSYKSQPKSFKLFLIFSQWYSQKYAWNFWKFENWNFNDFFFIFLNIYGYDSQNFKMPLLLQITAEGFQIFPEFSSHWSSQKKSWDFWNFENWNFNDLFFRFR